MAGEGVLQPVDVAIVLLNPQVVVNAAEIAAETVLKITAPSQTEVAGLLEDNTATRRMPVHNVPILLRRGPSNW